MTKSTQTKINLMKLKPIIITGIIVFLLLYSKDIADSIRLGIRISVFSVIPSIFPFLILADYLSSDTGDILFKTKIAKLFAVPTSLTGALICGLVCGFPCGIKYAVTLYNHGEITKEELEKSIALVNTPSLAFVISAVGVGMQNSLKRGVLLYISLILSVLITSRLFKTTNQISTNSGFISKQNFNFVESVKNAGYSSVTISSYIIISSAMLGIVKGIISSPLLIAFFASFLEIGNATTLITNLIKNSYLAFFAYGFSLGFSGISVFLQGAALLPAEISKRKYIPMKLCEGLVCGFLSLATIILF